MFDLMTTFAMMPPSDGKGGGGFESMLPTLIMFGAIILIMYFLMIRPQQKRAKAHQAMLDSIHKGDKVITTSGIHGTVVDIDGNTFIIQIADNVKISIEKQALASKKQ
jgi:preprotein translocase subunit YajC